MTRSFHSVSLEAHIVGALTRSKGDDLLRVERWRRLAAAPRRSQLGGHRSAVVREDERSGNCALLQRR